ncbi:UNVERIFIED_CONTAM: hypothetical protein FKN15_070594 [Acipenser sinensis]
MGFVSVGARSVLGASTLSARISTLDASALDARCFDARCTHLDARRFGASTLGARTSTLDASAHRRSVHAPRRSTLRRIDARCTHLDARRFGASTLGARTSTLDASRRLGARRSVHASRHSVLTPRRSTLRCIDARCTHLDARRFGARRYTRRRLDARCTHLDARRLGARRLDAWCTRLDARCSHLDARRFEVLSIAVSNLTMERKQIQYRHSELEKNYSNISEKYSALDQYCPVTDTSSKEVLSIAVSNLTMERKQIQYRHSELEKNYSNISEKYSALDQYCPVTDTSSKERVCEACPQNWVLFNGKCYYFSTDRMNWNSSRDNCTSMGGHLVIIESEAEQEFIHSQTGRIRDFFWIGLSDEVTEGEFLWVDNTPPSTTTEEAALVLAGLCALSMAAIIFLSVYIYNFQTKYLELQSQYSELERNYTDIAATIFKACPQNWELLNGKCYYISTDRMNWNSSRDNCTSLGGHLVIIESDGEQRFLSDKAWIVTQEQSHWIGLTDAVTEGTWLWVDGTPLIGNVKAKFWTTRSFLVLNYVKEPDDYKGEDPSGEDCAKLQPKRNSYETWFDSSYKKQYKRICETKAVIH